MRIFTDSTLLPDSAIAPDVQLDASDQESSPGTGNPELALASRRIGVPCRTIHRAGSYRLAVPPSNPHANSLIPNLRPSPGFTPGAGLHEKCREPCRYPAAAVPIGMEYPAMVKWGNSLIEEQIRLLAPHYSLLYQRTRASYSAGTIEMLSSIHKLGLLM